MAAEPVAEESGVAKGTADVVWRTGAGAGEAAQRGQDAQAEFGFLHENIVHPTFAEVVLLGETVAAAFDQSVAEKLFVALPATARHPAQERGPD